MKIPNKAIIEFEYNDENREYIFNIKELYDIIKEKQLIIDKATEYLKENACYDGEDFCRDLIYYECRELLDILKGSDKE